MIREEYPEEWELTEKEKKMKKLSVELVAGDDWKCGCCSKCPFAYDDSEWGMRCVPLNNRECEYDVDDDAYSLPEDECPVKAIKR